MATHKISDFHLVTLMYCMLWNEPFLHLLPLDNFSRIHRFIFLLLSFFSVRDVLLLLPLDPRPAQPSPKVLWCVTSHLTLKAAKSQFSDKGNLNLSGDTIYRSDKIWSCTSCNITQRPPPLLCEVRAVLPESIHLINWIEVDFKWH